MGSTWFERPIVWGCKLSDVVIYEYLLVLRGIDLPEARLRLRNVRLERV